MFLALARQHVVNIHAMLLQEIAKLDLLMNAGVIQPHTLTCSNN